MRKLLAPLFRIVAVAALVAPLLASAADLKVRKPKADELGQQVTCAVMNQQLKVEKDTPVIDYKGKAYFFCCDHCVGQFKKSPAKYASAAKAQLSVRTPAAAELGTKARCAVQGTEFAVEADTPVIDYKGKPYFFCCPSCVTDFKANPDKYALK